MDAIEDDPWVKYYIKDQVFVNAHKGRLAIVQKNWDLALDHWDIYFDNLKNQLGEKGMLRKESVSWEYYDYGVALKGAGRIMEAKRKWCETLRLPDEPGNHVWKKKAQEALKTL